MNGGFRSRRQQRHASIWRFVLLLFALRALVPAGFMPDFSAAQGGRFALAFCTANGPKTRVVDLVSSASKDDAAKSGSHGVAGECSFGVSAAPALPAIATVALPAAARVPAAHVSAPLLTASTPRGPPLGSRAPPALLG